jgi:hypothetical protein
MVYILLYKWFMVTYIYIYIYIFEIIIVFKEICEHGNEPSSFVNGWELLDYLSDCQLLKKVCVSWSSLKKLFMFVLLAICVQCLPHLVIIIWFVVMLWVFLHFVHLLQSVCKNHNECTPGTGSIRYRLPDWLPGNVSEPVRVFTPRRTVCAHTLAASGRVVDFFYAINPATQKHALLNRIVTGSCFKNFPSHTPGKNGRTEGNNGKESSKHLGVGVRIILKCIFLVTGYCYGVVSYKASHALLSFSDLLCVSEF